MTARSIRRAAERQAAKLARKAEKAAVHSVGIQLDSEPEASATTSVSPGPTAGEPRQRPAQHGSNKFRR